MDRDSIHVVSVVDFWMGAADQRTFGLCAAAPLLTNQTSSSPEKVNECLASIPPKESDV